MSFWRTFLDLLLPRHCVVCNAELDSSEQDLCNVCLCHLLPVTWKSATDNPLLRSVWSRHDVEAAGSSFYYNHTSDFHKLFIDIKYHGCPQIGERMARIAFPIWGERGLGQGISYIIPVPLSFRRKLKRGYNQAEWIARGVSTVTGIPLCTDILKRVKDNESQTHMNATQRQKNSTEIFVAKTSKIDLNGKSILLVDDIMTTGATICDCIRALRQAYPSIRVQIYTLGWAGDK